MGKKKTGKKAAKAGSLRPASRKNRVRVNARLSAMARTIDDRPTRNKQSSEQWVITLVTRIVGTKVGVGSICSDDIASDIILQLLDAGGFGWEEEEIIEFCRKKASAALVAFKFRKEVSACEFENLEGENFFFDKILGSYPPEQDLIVDAKTAMRQVQAIPNQQRQALEILCDGGNPIDVAEEMNITPWLAIKLIKEGREYVDRVDPIDD